MKKKKIEKEKRMTVREMPNNEQEKQAAGEGGRKNESKAKIWNKMKSKQRNLSIALQRRSMKNEQ